MLKNLIFDVYGTLVSTGNGSVAATAEIFREFGLEDQAEEIYKEWKKYHKENTSKCGEFKTEKEMFAEDLRILFEKKGITADSKEKVKPMIDSLYGRILFPDVEEAMGSIIKSYHVAIGSTTDDAPLLDSIKGTVLEKIEWVFTSESLRKYKPCPDFYSGILNRTGWKAEETVFIGDSMDDDVIGPGRVGMKTILINRKEIKDAERLKIPDAVISSMSELKAAIERIEQRESSETRKS